MTTSRGIPVLSLTAALLLGPAALQAGHHGGRHGMSVSTEDGADPGLCRDLSIRFDERPAARAEESRTFAVESGKAFTVRVPENSGAYVHGADRQDFEVLVCKGAPDRTMLDRISASRSGGVLTVNGPAGEDWVGYLIIAAPRGAAIDLSGVNGPIALSGLYGRVTARSQNGPISVASSTGEIDAEAENGPISVRGDAGRVRVRTENGPIGIRLAGLSWNGGLDARAVNGPVSLAVPAGYRSGTVVQSLGHSPFSCRGDACTSARRTWDDDRQADLAGRRSGGRAPLDGERAGVRPDGGAGRRGRRLSRGGEPAPTSSSLPRGTASGPCAPGSRRSSR